MDKLKKDFLLLKNIVSTKDTFAERVNLSAAERLILKELPEAMSLAHATNDTMSEYLTSLVSDINDSIDDLKDCRERMEAIQEDLFSEIKQIGDIVHIIMPELPELDLIRDNTPDPEEPAPDEHREKHSTEHDNELQRILSERFENIRLVFNSPGGDTGVNAELLYAISDKLNIPANCVKFNKI